LKEVSNAQQGCIYLFKNTVKQQYCEILQFKIIFYHVIHSYDGRPECSGC